MHRIQFPFVATPFNYLYAKQFIKLDIIGNNISGIVAGGKSEIMEAGRLQVFISFFFLLQQKKIEKKTLKIVTILFDWGTFLV